MDTSHMEDVQDFMIHRFFFLILGMETSQLIPSNLGRYILRPHRNGGSCQRGDGGWAWKFQLGRALKGEDSLWNGRIMVS